MSSKLLQVVTSSADTTIDMGRDHTPSRAVLKEVSLSTTGTTSNIEYASIDVGFLDANVHNENNNDRKLLVMPLNTTTFATGLESKRTEWKPNISFTDLHIPKKFDFKVFEEDITNHNYG